MDERIGIVLADDHTMVRRGLRMVLEAEEGLHVLAEAGEIEDALRSTREHQPSIVVVDLHMPGAATLPAIERFREAAPGSEVVVLTMDADVGLARAALAAGAKGYVLKEGAESELVNAVRAASAGRTYLDPALGARLAASSSEPDELFAVGATFAGHRIDAVAGKGGMAIVYRATDMALDRPVALKVIAPALAADPAFRTRFERECRLAARLDHPNVVPVFHAGEEAGRLYVTMRFVVGTDLRAMIRELGPLDPLRAAALVGHVAAALDEAHTHDLVHRDVKPANVLIGHRDASEQAFLTDFGISKHRSSVDAGFTATGIAIGTPDYMSPEQAEGRDVDARADVYSLGCVVFQMLSGRIPFERESDVDKLWAHVHEPPPALHSVRPGLPEELTAAVSRALAKDPADRHPSAGALARELLAALGR